MDTLNIDKFMDDFRSWRKGVLQELLSRSAEPSAGRSSLTILSSPSFPLPRTSSNGERFSSLAFEEMARLRREAEEANAQARTCASKLQRMTSNCAALASIIDTKNSLQKALKDVAAEMRRKEEVHAKDLEALRERSLQEQRAAQQKAEEVESAHKVELQQRSLVEEELRLEMAAEREEHHHVLERTRLQYQQEIERWRARACQLEQCFSSTANNNMEVLLSKLRDSRSSFEETLRERDATIGRLEEDVAALRREIKFLQIREAVRSVEIPARTSSSSSSSVPTAGGDAEVSENSMWTEFGEEVDAVHLGKFSSGDPTSGLPSKRHQEKRLEDSLAKTPSAPRPSSTRARTGGPRSLPPSSSGGIWSRKKVTFSIPMSSAPLGDQTQGPQGSQGPVHEKSSTSTSGTSRGPRERVLATPDPSSGAPGPSETVGIAVPRPKKRKLFAGQSMLNEAVE